MTEKQFKQINDGVKDTGTDKTLTNILEFALELKELNDLFDCVFDRNR